MQRNELERKADQIEVVLHQHRTPGRVTGGNVTPRWIQFLLQTAPGVKVNRVESLSREIALALGVPAARITTQGGAVRIDVPRADPEPVKALKFMARLPTERLPIGTAVLGLADDGGPLLMRLPSPEVAHVLVAGTTGSGKTALLQTMIVSLAWMNHRKQLQFVLIDPKGRSFEALAGLPHLLEREIISRPEAALAMLRKLIGVMEKRDRDKLHEPRLIVVIDELIDLIGIQPGILEALQRLVQRGREAGIHVIASTQKPSAAVIGPIVKANFPVRLVGRVVSQDDARVAAGISGTGAEKLTGSGDFLAVSGEGIVRFQAAYFSRAEIQATVQKLQSGRELDDSSERAAIPLLLNPLAGH